MSWRMTLPSQGFWKAYGEPEVTSTLHAFVARVLPFSSSRRILTLELPNRNRLDHQLAPKQARHRSQAAFDRTIQIHTSRRRGQRQTSWQRTCHPR
eukprot:3068238-Rhodomonas_salina.1